MHELRRTQRPRSLPTTPAANLHAESRSNSTRLRLPMGTAVQAGKEATTFLPRLRNYRDLTTDHAHEHGLAKPRAYPSDPKMLPSSAGPATPDAATAAIKDGGSCPPPRPLPTPAVGKIPVTPAARITRAVVSVMAAGPKRAVTAAPLDFRAGLAPELPAVRNSSAHAGLLPPLGPCVTTEKPVESPPTSLNPHSEIAPQS